MSGASIAIAAQSYGYGPEELASCWKKARLLLVSRLRQSL